MPHFQAFQSHDLETFLAPRPGEVKLGERVQLPGLVSIEDKLRFSDAKFVVMGLPEDIGVRANGGIGGAQTAWNPFLKSFLNIQETEALHGNLFLILGSIDFNDWLEACADVTTEVLREYTSKMDELVFPIIQMIIDYGKIPIVIGGGHNNAYPLLKGLSASKEKPVNVINLDAHSDFRMKEGRHSGNGFRYAYEAGFLKKYALLGLHEAYNSQTIVSELQSNPDLLPLFFEDIFLRNKMDWNTALSKALGFVKEKNFGVELDVDCIENVLSSAATPVGITTQQAMQYLYQCGQQTHVAYLHLPEAVSQRADGLQDVFTGKLLSYLVQAFCKGVLER